MDKILKQVLIIGPENRYGGMGSVINTYIDKMGIKEHIFTYSRDSRINYFLKGLIKYARTIIQNKEIKIIHIHSASNGSFYRKSLFLLIGKLVNKKIIFHIHGGGFREFYSSTLIGKKYIRYILKKSDRIICLSDNLMNFFAEELGIKNVISLGNPIEINECRIDVKENAQIKLLFLGNINEEKGIFWLIDFLKENTHFKKDEIILEIGGIGDTDKLKSKIEAVSDNENIHYLGWLDQEAKTKYLSECTIFILPSKTEALPISILEAMSFGKPIIATNVGGIPSIVKESHNGWLFDFQNHHQLQNIIDNIFLDREKIKLFGINSKQMASQYSTSNIKNKLMKIYNSLIPINS